MDLNSIWFVLVGILFTGYAVLDGFDLGAGPLLLMTREDRDRRVILNAIGPIWNGNEVWLVTGGGALFAAFPHVYATVFSGFYDAFMLLLCALIFRAAAIEFRSQKPDPGWRRTWDIAFAISSLVSALVAGIVLGNIVRGIPLNAKHEFQGDLLTLLHPYALFVGITAVALFVMHANLYLILKSEGDFQETLMRWSKYTVPAFLACFLILNGLTIFNCSQIEAALRQRPFLLGLIFVVSLIVTFNIRREVGRRRDRRAFLCSCLSIVTLMLLFGAAVYPTLVFSTPEPGNGLNIYNSASTAKSLRFMFYVALVGVPIVLTYTATIYYVFRGKVTLTEESY